MSQLNQMELQNLRQLIGEHDTSSRSLEKPMPSKRWIRRLKRFLNNRHRMLSIPNNN